jgi:hypothetical protein
MFRFKAFALVALIAILGLSACADVTGPGQQQLCPITGGPGTCAIQR